MPDRRQSIDQRGRHRRPALRDDARSGAGARSGAARWPRAWRSQRASQEQHRLRSARSFHRRGRHARDHHGGYVEALLATRDAGDRIGRGVRSEIRRRIAVSPARCKRRCRIHFRAVTPHRARSCIPAYPEYERSLRQGISVVRAAGDRRRSRGDRASRQHRSGAERCHELW